MKNILNKIGSLYSFEHMVYKYQIAYYADVIAMFIMNIIGLIWISAPVALLIAIAWNTPIEQYSMLNKDTFYGVCLFNFFYYGLSFIFFMHNKSKLGSYTMGFGWASFGVAVVFMFLEMLYHFVRYNFKMLMNPQEYLPVVYLDLFIVAIVAIIYLANNAKVKKFFDRILQPYQG